MMQKKSARWAMITSFALIAGILGISAWQLLGSRRAEAPLGDRPSVGVAHAHASDAKQLYTCGMHPNVVQEGPGTCPICGMDLTPMKGAPGAADGEAHKSGGKDTITVDPVMVQNMGVRVAHAKRGALSRRVRTIGEVVVAEDLVSVVNLKYSGWIERLYVDQTGVKVRRGQRLLSVYSPELVSAQEEYLLALRSTGKDTPLARSARARLSFWDLNEGAIKRIEQRGKAVRNLTISAPRSGYVLHKNVVQGAKVNAGQDLFRIGRLDAIWVQAQVYEFDAPWIRVGQRATMELSFEQGRQFSGKVSYIYPTLNPKTRTLTVRLEFVNPSLQLKPGMFTTVWIETRQRSDILTIPTEAIIHSGERNIVFTTTEVGKYIPRQVITGLSGDGHITEIKSGITAGEAVVVSGQFLLDSESQLQEALQKLLASRLQAQPGAKVSSPQQTPASGHVHGEAGWTCPMHPMIAEQAAGSCPICGMDLVQAEANKGENPSDERKENGPAGR